jgi:hypothetical protein
MKFRRFIAPWILALVAIGAIEAAIYTAYKPNSVERSDFLVMPIQRNLALLGERWIIWDKMRKLPAQAPIAVQAGDSSGFFGIMPDVVAQYIGGKQLLDLSCCANQGFQGYLALLEVALQKYPSLRYAIVYAAPPVTLNRTLWPSDKAEEIVVSLAGQTMPVLGDAMQANLLSYRRYLYPPSNALRPEVSDYILTHGYRAAKYILTHDVAKPPGEREPNAVFERADVMHVRNGYMIEHDVQWAIPNGCQPLMAPRDPATGRTYWDLFAEAFVRLGKKYNVSPVVVFQPTSAVPCNANADFRDEIARLRTAYPSLKIPYDPVETWPENFFTGPNHVQRTIAIETSRRLGRALRALESGSDMAENLAANGPILSNPKMHVIGATLIEECGWNPDYKAGYYADVSEVFREACDGKTECAYQKGSDTRDQLPPNPSCKPVYLVDYQCPGEPVRSVREEGRETFDGLFRINCRASSFLARDPAPYGIQVAYATYGGDAGVIGNATTPIAALCQGRMSCDYVVDGAKLGGPANGLPKALEVAYRCDRELATRVVTLPDADNGATLHLDCATPLAPVSNPITAAVATYGGECGAAPGNSQYLLATLCEGKERCTLPPMGSILGIAAPACAKDLKVDFRCSADGRRTTVVTPNGPVRLDCSLP